MQLGVLLKYIWMTFRKTIKSIEVPNKCQRPLVNTPTASKLQIYTLESNNLSPVPVTHWRQTVCVVAAQWPWSAHAPSSSGLAFAWETQVQKYLSSSLKVRLIIYRFVSRVFSSGRQLRSEEMLLSFFRQTWHCAFTKVAFICFVKCV